MITDTPTYLIVDRKVYQLVGNYKYCKNIEQSHLPTAHEVLIPTCLTGNHEVYITNLRLHNGPFR